MPWAPGLWDILPEERQLLWLLNVAKYTTRSLDTTLQQMKKWCAHYDQFIWYHHVGVVPSIIINVAAGPSVQLTTRRQHDREQVDEQVKHMTVTWEDGVCVLPGALLDFFQFSVAVWLHLGNMLKILKNCWMSLVISILTRLKKNI